MSADRGMTSQVVEPVDEADFLLAHGTECLGRAGDAEPRKASLDEIREVLEAGAKRGLPLLVANPDIVTVSGSGLIVMPGTFGRWYKEMGGQVSTISLPQLMDGCWTMTSRSKASWRPASCLPQCTVVLTPTTHHYSRVVSSRVTWHWSRICPWQDTPCHD